MNQINKIELNNNLEYWHGYIDANLSNYNRLNISNVNLDNTFLEIFILEDETQFTFMFYENGIIVGKQNIFIGNNQLQDDFNKQLNQELIKMFKSLDIKNQII